MSPRDRSLVTISVLIATGKPAQLAGHLGRALDNGVQPCEASGLLAHLAIYCGWPSAVSALEVYEQVYTARKVDTAALRGVGPRLPAPASDAARAKAVTDELGAVAPKFVQLTNEVVFDDLWRRSDFSLRDRSLVTIAALAAMGDDDQLDVYLRRGLESGLTRSSDHRGLDPSGLLRRLAEGDQGDDGGHEGARQVTASSATRFTKRSTLRRDLLARTKDRSHCGERRPWGPRNTGGLQGYLTCFQRRLAGSSIAAIGNSP